MNEREYPTSAEMLPAVLAARATATPDDTCVVEAETGLRVTNRELHEESLALAAGLRGLGVGADDTVATMLPHSADTYRLWFALSRLGALEVPVSTRFRGRMVAHLLEDSRATVVVVDAPLVGAMADVLARGELSEVKTVVVRGGVGGGVSSEGLGEVTVVALDDLRSGADPAVLVEPRPRDLSLVLYTSGTTGPSKGVLVPWGQVHATVTGVFPEGTCTPGKVLYGPFPPNHIGGRLFVGIGIHYGLPAVVRDTFSASAYWTDVAAYGCTTTALVSAMVAILASAPPRDDDAHTTLHDVLMNPLTADHREFEERFGVRVCTDFNMTETSIPLHSGWDVDDWRSCGRVRPGPPGYELRLVDAADRPVAPGEVGELVCRTSVPWTMNAGYLGRPEATARAWRNGWFHTGDTFRADAEGRYYFVDRLKDSIRRRGENVSSFEVEREVLDHPDVVECAAIGVPAELGEEDIKVFAVRRPGSALTEDELIAHVRERAAGFMVPRYVEFLDELPRTEATQKVRKGELRDRAASRDEQEEGR